MKLKRGILLTILILAVVSILGTSNSVQAATAVSSKTLNIKAVRSSGYGYKVVNNGAKYIWKIYNTRNDINETFYCIKGGPGFGGESMDSAIGEAEYTEVFDMRKPSTITTTYRTPISLIYGTKDYERLMWVLDQCYIPAKNNASTEDRKVAEDSKKALLDAVEAYAKKYPQVYPNTSDFNDRLVDNLTNDDIDAIQQLAVWYYTNDDAYHVDNNPTIQLGYQDNSYSSLSPSDDEDNARIHAMDALFAYLTQTPKAAGFSYDYETDGETSSPVEIKQTNPIVVTEGNRHIVGPYTINQLRNITYTLNATFTDGNGTTITDVKFLNSSKVEVSGATIKDMVGNNKVFYISIPQATNATNIRMSITGNYFDTTINYWSVANPDPRRDQPVVQVEKGNKPITGHIDAQKEPDKEFDLALRKFITSINGKTLTGSDSRVPTISSTELQNLANKQATGCNSTTANKVHRKDALKVKTGDKVVYTIRIYNEGEISGFATKVTDYLPDGLKFLPANESTINAAYGWTNPSGDGKTIETVYLANHKIDAFNGTNLDYEDLQIECEVIATPGETAKSMKNVAEITEHRDENGNTGTNLKDRDSTPGSLTNSQINNYGEQPNNYQDDDDFEHLIMEPTVPKKFDLALRKFITSIDGKTLTGDNSREPVITAEELQRLANQQATGINNTSAKKEHRKDPLTVQTGNKVVYTIRVYNEGEVAGWATQITDHLPSGLKFVPAAESTINSTYGWTVSEDGKTVTTNYLAAENKKINAFNGTTLDYEDVQIECEVMAVAGAGTKTLKNIAEITGNKDEDGNTNRDLDQDSKPGNLTDDQIKNYGTTSKEDDDDFEDLKLLPKNEKIFDLSLRKFISDVKTNGKSHVLTSREPVVDTKPLLEGENTANYNHTKKPVGVSNNDIVTYTIRVYNEGQIDGYVTEIKDHLPPQLEFLIDDELNKQYGWQIVEESNGRVVKTDITSPKTTNSANRDLIYADRSEGNDKVLLKAFGYEEGDTLDYIDVQIRCKVKENINLYQKITNIAEISEFTDKEGLEVEDRDSQEDNTTIPSDETLPEYKDPEIESGKTYILGQQDDDDFEKLELRIFDLALRKFITGVTNGEKTTEITNRAPVFVKNGTEYSYEHTKEPVDVANGNIVIYTLRIFNEGNVAGYASKVKDDLPQGLEFLPEHSVNTAFLWKMYKEDGTETKEVSEAKYIETDFLSKDKEKTEKENLISAFNPATMDMPDYKDVKIAFKVTEPNTSDRIIINQAQISDDSDEDGNPVDDVDSTPDEWNEGEDDQDIEKIKVKYFDLSLKKWVTESIVTVDGKTTVTKSGHTGNENPEPPMKVEIPYGKTNTIVVKFRFNIKVTNEGEIAGYAKEIEDYIPAGLKFVAKDNPKWKEKDGRVTTDQLKDKLLQPGESATVNIVLTWINGKNNMGEKVNWAEISKDENEYNSPDIDSTPGNKVKGEDDIDQAPVLLAPATGSSQTYAILVLGCTSILAGGIFLIKKYVI